MPTSGGHNVEHRRTNPTDNSHPVDRAGNRSGGAAADASGHPAIGATYATTGIPYAGVRTGEIVGFRLWWAIIDRRRKTYLRSVFVNRIWLPGEPMSGNVDIRVGIDLGAMPPVPIYSGIYAYSRYGRLPTAAAFWIDRIGCGGCFMSEISLSDSSGIVLALVGGRVKLWGGVIECEDGYRASFAKPLSLDTVFWENPIHRLDGTGLDNLRRRYCSSARSTL